MSRRHVVTIAAASAFWLFLSLVPMTILVTSLLPYTPLTQDAIMDFMLLFAPESLQQLLSNIVRDVYSAGLGVLSLSLLTTLWSAAMGFAALIRGLEEIYERPRRSGHLARRLRSILCVLALLAALVLAVVFIALGQSFQELLTSHFPRIQSFFTFLLKLRYGAVQCVMVLLFSALYRWAPGLRQRYVHQLPGAIFATLGWSLFSALFSFWIRLTNGYGTYGSLATVAVVMVWLYYCMQILLWGACLNKSIQRLRFRRSRFESTDSSEK